MKATLQEKRAWIRLGWELAALEKLVLDALCDGEYQDVMGKTAMNGLSRAYDGINQVRQAADSRSSRRVALFGPDLFYGSGLEPARKMAEELRKHLTAEATATGDRLYNLKEADTNGG